MGGQIVGRGVLGTANCTRSAWGERDAYKKRSAQDSQFPPLPGSGRSRVDTAFTLMDL